MRNRSNCILNINTRWSGWTGILVDTVIFENTVRAGHDTHIAARTLLFVVFHIPGLRILFHSACHAGIHALRSVAVATENRRRFDLTIDGHAVSRITTLCLMADYTGCDTGQAANAAASVNFNTIHRLPPYSSTFSKRIGVAL